MLGRNSIQTWSHLMIKAPIAVAATAAVGLSFTQLALGQSDWSPTSIRYNGLHHSTRTRQRASRESGRQQGRTVTAHYRSDDDRGKEEQGNVVLNPRPKRKRPYSGDANGDCRREVSADRG